MTDALASSPDRAWLCLTDCLPRKATLDADDRGELPEALRGWVRFALLRRGVGERWVEPVVAAVDENAAVYENLAEFEEAFGDPAAQGPAMALAPALECRGVDLSDRSATQRAISALQRGGPGSSAHRWPLSDGRRRACATDPGSTGVGAERGDPEAAAGFT